MLNKQGTEIEKGWGSETILISTELYCTKLMSFNKDKRFSLHFHKDKDETWYVVSGVFHLITVDHRNAEKQLRVLVAGDTHRNKPLEMHRLICIEPGVVLETSTPDHKEDNYRVSPGDSQRDNT